MVSAMASDDVDYIGRAFGLSDALRQLADEGEANTDDVDRFVLFGIIRDCAYKIRKSLERIGCCETGMPAVSGEQNKTEPPSSGQ